VTLLIVFVVGGGKRMNLAWSALLARMALALPSWLAPAGIDRDLGAKGSLFWRQHIVLQARSRSGCALGGVIQDFLCRSRRRSELILRIAFRSRSWSRCSMPSVAWPAGRAIHGDLEHNYSMPRLPIHNLSILVANGCLALSGK
jgi:hypothetical protein